MPKIGTVIDRRSFLTSAGASFILGLSEQSSWAVQNTDAILASAYREQDGQFGVAILTERGDVIHTYKLPARGHDVVFRPKSKQVVAFARRPGTFAAVIDTLSRSPVKIISAPVGRHFYGHGCFSDDANLLFATENDFDNERGIIGIYDARNDYERVGEFESYGVGPHEMALSPDRRILVVANGGIATHPDFPRTKLNIASMAPNLAFINAEDRSLIAKTELAPSMHKLSIRHLTLLGDQVWFACQNEGDISEAMPLVGSASLSHGGHKMLQMPRDQLMRLRGYIGSIASNELKDQIAFTSPRGGVAFEMDTKTGEVVSVKEQADICGVTALRPNFITTSGTGHFGRKVRAHTSAFHWDNHIASARS